MKIRYLLIPFIIITIMILVLDKEKELVNKEIISDTKNISYPFFSNDNIDNYISDFLNDFTNNKGSVFIDYDYIDKNNLYYLTFYKYIFNNNKINYDSNSFVIDKDNSSVTKTDNNMFDFDYITNNIKDKDNKYIALTFDDGPNYNTNKVLDILNKYNVKATFFVLGSKIKGNEDILKRMKDSGMEIGNHTYNHLLLTKYKEDKIKEEIDSTSNLIFEVTGSSPRLLRPSYGSFNKKIKKCSNLPIIIWDIDTLDWKYHNSKKIASRVINKVKDGDIILMHDIYSATSNSLNIIIPKLLNNGYTFVTVPELFYYKNISLENGKVYGYAR